MRDFRDAKAMARTLRAALAAKGLKIKISQSLELIAEIFGEADWNTLAAAIRAAGTARRHDASPSPPPAAEAATAAPEPGQGPGSRFSRPLEATLQRAMACANQRNHEYATLEHLLLALIDDADASAVMNDCKVDLAALQEQLSNHIDTELKQLVIDHGRDPSPTAAFQRVIQRAVIDVRFGEEVTGADVLVAIFPERKSHAAYCLAQQGISRADALPARRRHRRSPSDDAIQSDLREPPARVLVALTPREEGVLRMRFGIGIDSGHTLEEVGQQFMVTPERIRQIEAKALRKLKHPSAWRRKK